MNQNNLIYWAESDATRPLAPPFIGSRLETYLLGVVTVGLGEPLLEVAPLVVQVDLDKSGGRKADQAKGQSQRKLHG